MDIIRPKATVLIPTKNGGEIFKKVLARVIDQQAPWPFEILVIDSGSSDGTVELCRQFKKVQLHTIEPQEFGHGRTRNLGVNMARGEFVALITQDALPTSNNWLETMVSVIEQDPAIAGAFGRHIAYPDASPFTRNELEQHFSLRSAFHFLPWVFFTVLWFFIKIDWLGILILIQEVVYIVLTIVTIRNFQRALHQTQSRYE